MMGAVVERAIKRIVRRRLGGKDTRRRSEKEGACAVIVLVLYDDASRGWKTIDDTESKKESDERQCHSLEEKVTSMLPAMPAVNPIRD